MFSNVNRNFGRALCGLVLAGVVVFAPAVRAEDDKPLHEVCANDIRHYCGSVTLGHGRLLSCLYAHEDKLEAQCDAATGAVGDLIDGSFAVMLEALEICEPDAHKLCSDVGANQGEILLCLETSKAEVSEECAASLPRMPTDLFDAAAGENTDGETK